MAPIETARGYVNAWDCDENDHLNVQFYVRFFEEGAAHYFHMTDRKPSACAVRHVRYHRELLTDDLIAVETEPVDVDGQTFLQHVLREDESGDVAATALEFYGDLGGTPAAVDPAALPRSLAIDPASPEFDEAALVSKGAFPTHRGVVRAQECLNGVMTSQALVSRFSDSAPHVWATCGISSEWLHPAGFGRVAVELKVTHGEPLRMDSKARKAAPWPEELRAGIAARLVEIG